MARMAPPFGPLLFGFPARYSLATEQGRKTVANIRLDYAVPAADLTDFVTLFYDFQADVPVFEDTERADHAQFRFRLSPGRADYRFPDGSEQSSSDIHIIGPTSGAMHVRAVGPVAVFGMGLTPAGWGALIGIHASTMLNRVIDPADFLCAVRLREAAAALGAAADLAEKVALIEALLRDLMRGGPIGATQFMRQVDSWLAGSPSPDLEELVAATDLSRRQIERKCKALYGAPPKLLARKYRALRAAVALVADGDGIDDVIARGFYDQSHLIREVKQFTGLTPRQIQAAPTILAQLTILQRTALGGQVHPLISDT